MICIDRRTIFLYFFLFAGAFNDILRIPSTQITLFRVLIPVELVITAYCSRKARTVYCVFLGLSVLAFIQSFVFCKINSLGVDFDLTRLVKYLILYGYVFLVIGAVITIYEQSPDGFADGFEKYIITVVVLYLVIFVSIAYRNWITRHLYLNNVNDYGAMLTMTFPLLWYWFKKTGKHIYLTPILLAVSYFYWNDCVLSIISCTFQIFLLLYWVLRNKASGSGRKVLLIASFAIIVLGISCYLSISGFSFQGYSWDDVVVDPIKHILRGRLFDKEIRNTYRTNVMITGVRWLAKTGMLGIGAGNSGRWLRLVLNENTGMPGWFFRHEIVAVHNAFLETLLEWGLVAAIGIVIVVKMVIDTVRKSEMTEMDMCFATVMISSLLWLQSPSGILTDYLIIIVLSYLIICNRKIWNSEGVLGNR